MKLAPVTLDACADCHPDAVESFLKTGMGRSLYRVKDAAIVEDYGHAQVVHASGLSYRAFIDAEGRWWQSELDRDGQEIQRVEVTHVIGSGHHTRSYLGVVHGRLIQLPLTWYARRRRWDMSPGYEGLDQLRFDRPVKADCLYCHNDLTPVDPRRPAHYTAPLADGITCARCHGDGRRHVAARLAGAEDDSLLRPQTLSPEGQLQLCQRCHLQGAARVLAEGARWDAEDPRTPLPARLSIYGPRSRGGVAFGIAGHGARLAQSRCFTASAATQRPLVCTTCHDPHGPTPAEAHQQACLSCHEVEVCGEAHRGPCAGCHMPKGPTSDIPHVEFTDHLIQRPGRLGPPRQGPIVALVGPATPEPVRDFLAQAEIWRSEGGEPGQILALAASLGEQVKAPRVQAALGALRQAAGDGAGAAEAWAQAAASGVVSWRLAYGQALTEVGRLAEARQVFEGLVRDHPDEGHGWSNLANLLQRQGDLQAAARAYDKAVSLRPADGAIVSNQGINLVARGQQAAGLAALREAVRVEPAAGPPRYNLAMQILISGGPAEEAQGVVAEGLKLGVDFPPLWLLQGQIHLTRAPGEVAADVDRYLAAGGRPQPEMYLLLWQGAARAGQPEAARAALEAGAARFPSDQRLSEALRRAGGRGGP